MLDQLLAKSPSDLKIIGIAFIGLFFWKVLLASGPSALKVIRKFFLFLFTIFCLPPYMRQASKLTDILTQTYDINAFILKVFGTSKGSDWANGIIITTFFFMFVGIDVYFWLVEKKASMPPPEKPIKIEAKLGNLNTPK